LYAEQAYEDDTASASELSLAYIAHRKALEATALGKAARLEQRAAEGKDREQVKHENRQLVITLSGAVLFEFGKAALLPAARRSLDDVAAALKT